ncbi:MAG TPA: hypothetical protein VF941_05060 [Clostridia bacterium]
MKRTKTEYTFECYLNGKKSTPEEVNKKYIEKYGKKKEQKQEQKEGT